MSPFLFLNLFCHVHHMVSIVTQRLESSIGLVSLNVFLGPLEGIFPCRFLGLHTLWLVINEERQGYVECENHMLKSEKQNCN